MMKNMKKKHLILPILILVLLLSVVIIVFSVPSELDYEILDSWEGGSNHHELYVQKVRGYVTEPHENHSNEIDAEQFRKLYVAIDSSTVVTSRSGAILSGDELSEGDHVYIDYNLGPFMTLELPPTVTANQIKLRR